MTLDDIISPATQPKLLGQGYGFTEGPAADAQGNVYFSDGKNDSIYCWQVGNSVVRGCADFCANGAVPTLNSGKGDSPIFADTKIGTVPVVLFADDSTDANGMMVNSRGELYVCEGAAHRVVAFDVQTKAKRVLCREIGGQHFNEPNDLAIDFSDGFYFSDPNYQHRGQPTAMKQDVYYCSADGTVTRVSTVCHKPNGVLLSADDTALYVADARGQAIYKYDVLGPGRLANERRWIDQLGANPDGLTLDDRDNLYVCCGRAGLKIYDRLGTPLGQIDVHAANCCFGGPDFHMLSIASADKFLGIPTKVAGLRPLSLRASF